MGFKADSAVPKLDWDFTKYVPGAKGTSPEPSNLNLLRFNIQMRSLTEAEARRFKSMALREQDKLTGMSAEERQADIEKWAAIDPEGGTAEVIAELMAIVPPEEGERIAGEQAKLVAEVFQDCPSVEQIMALPGRIRLAYVGWVVGQLMSPEFGAVDTSS